MKGSLEVIYVAGPYSPSHSIKLPAPTFRRGILGRIDARAWKADQGWIEAREREEVAANVAAAVAFGQEVRTLGFVPMVPHVAILPTKDYEQAMAECFDLISRCDAVVLMPTWTQSPGARRECDFAHQFGLEVFGDLKALREAAHAIE